MKRILVSVMLLAFGLVQFQAQAQEKEKEMPPVGGKPKDFKLPDKKVVDFDNGLRLVMIPWGKIPKVTISVVVKTGNVHEGENEVWLSDLVGDMLKEGSISMDGNQVSDKLAGMGGGLNVGVGSYTTTLNTSVLYEFAPDAIEILSDVLRNPSFPESELERLINNKKRNLSVSLSRPRPKARQDFYQAIYPDQSYGRIYPTASMLDSYTIGKLKSFFQKNYGAQRTTVYVAGMFDEKEIESTVGTLLSSWEKGSESYYPKALAEESRSVSILDRPGAPQSTLMIGLPVVDPSHPDWMSLSVTNELLGGGINSRITRNIREDKGYTYSPRSMVNVNYGSGVWLEMADVSTNVTGPSLREITYEINKLQNEAPSEKELEGIKNYQAGIFVLRNSTPSGIISQLNFLDVHNLPESYLTDYVKNVLAVTPEKVREVTAKYIRPEDMTLVIVGDKKVIEKQIKEYEQGLKKY